MTLPRTKVLSFTFFYFPAAHGKHLRTTNPIESTFATVRHRTRQTKRCDSREATLSLVYKLSQEAEKCWRLLDGYKRDADSLRDPREPTRSSIPPRDFSRAHSPIFSI